MDQIFQKFIIEHSDDDVASLLFAAGRHPGVDVRKAAATIEARRRIAAKLPQWYAHLEIEYPNRLSLEQCSSEATALYKQQFVPEGGTLADITGGLGVDFHYMSRRASSALYVERNPSLCEAARHNFKVLGDDNVTVVNSDTLPEAVPGFSTACGRFSLIYADPARRSAADSRIYSIADCEPDIISLKPSLLVRTDSLLVKVSPMADISRTLELLPETSEVHVLAVDNECKELLLHIRSGPASSGAGPRECRIVCADITSSGTERFEFIFGEENSATCLFAKPYGPAASCGPIGKYIYQPNRAILKAGAFKLVASRFGLTKLDPSTHLYTSDAFVPDFPGRRMAVECVLDWNKKTIAELRSRYGSLEMTALNFPLDTDGLRRRTGIADGGPRHLYATTLSGRKLCIVTVPVDILFSSIRGPQ